MGGLRNIKKMLQEKLYVGDAEDWCELLEEHDRIWITSCIGEYYPEVLDMTCQQLQQFCIQLNIHNFNDLSSIMVLNLGLDTDLHEC